MASPVFGPGNHATLITLFSMTAGTLIGLMMAIRMTWENVAQPLQEARRLLDSVGVYFAADPGGTGAAVYQRRSR